MIVSFFFQFLQVLLRVSLRLALGVYGVMSLICVVFTMLLPIETKGRPMVVRFLRSLLLLLVLLFELLLLQTEFTSKKLIWQLLVQEKIYSDEVQFYSALQCCNCVNLWSASLGVGSQRKLAGELIMIVQRLTFLLSHPPPFSQTHVYTASPFFA